MRKLICWSVSSIACLCVLLKAESVQDRRVSGAGTAEAASPHVVSGYVRGSPTRYSFQVTARLTDCQGHFEVVSWVITQLTDQRSGPVAQADPQHGVKRLPPVPSNKGKVKYRTPFSRVYPIDLFLPRAAEEHH